MREDALGQHEKALVVERRASRRHRREERGERLEVAARAGLPARHRRHLDAGVGDESFQLGKERGVERLLRRRVRNPRPPRQVAVYARAARRGNEVIIRR